MTPEMRRLFDIYCELRYEDSYSGIPMFTEKVKLPEWSPYDCWFLDSCRIAP